jgi:V8-like Glu-specific endopeptidase
LSERRGGRLAPLALAAVLLVYLAATGTAANAFNGAIGGASSGRILTRTGPSEPGQATPFTGTAAVGALFARSNGQLGRHFCTASVVHSPAGDVLITAAHCMIGQSLLPAGNVVFAPGYHNGRFPLGVWAVTGEFVTARWTSRHDPDDDVAFLIVGRSGAAGSSSPRSLEHSTGAERLGVNTRLPDLIDAIGYPDTASRPVSCKATALAYRDDSLHQMMFDCGGFTDGTSGGPLLRAASARRAGVVIGVIGGYEQGGYTPQVSYSAVFAANIARLYQRAIRPVTS